MKRNLAFFTFYYVTSWLMILLLFKSKGKAVPFTALEWPREFQEVKVLRFHDNGTGWW